jgi:hypothetical protein
MPISSRPTCPASPSSPRQPPLPPPLPLSSPSSHSELRASQLQPFFRQATPLEVLLQPGDILFVPRFWPHRHLPLPLRSPSLSTLHPRYKRLFRFKICGLLASSVRALDHSISVTCFPLPSPLPRSVCSSCGCCNRLNRFLVTTLYRRMCGPLSVIFSSATSSAGNNTSHALSSSSCTLTLILQSLQRR